LINNEADCEAQDYFNTTPYGYALKFHHEDLCIFFIQKENEVNVPVNEPTQNEEHICNQIDKWSGFVNSSEIVELFKKKEELEALSDIEKIKENYKKLKAYSPFYFAIKNNMQGNIYLLLQRGFDQFAALSESIIHNKFDFFIYVLDSIDIKKIKKWTNDDGKNLMHILAEHTNENAADPELLSEVYELIINLKVDIEAEDDMGRIPLHYALKSHNVGISSKLLEGKSQKQITDTCNKTDVEGVSAFAMLYYKLSKNEQNSQSPLNSMFLQLFGNDVKDMIPFVRFDRNHFPYQFISYVVEDGEWIHPLILLMETSNDISSAHTEIIHFDLFKENPEDGLTLIDWLFKLGKVTYINNINFKLHVQTYLQDKKNVKKIEKLLSEPIKDDVYINYQRMSDFILYTFGVKLNISVKSDHKEFSKEFCSRVQVLYDYELDSENYLDREVPRLEKEEENAADRRGKEVQCKVDSTESTEKHCLVEKDEGEAGYSFDVAMKKVDIKYVRSVYVLENISMDKIPFMLFKF